MALRRLFSGWLIAMAALARSVAQALERASEDRSAPAPDPVMAALAERYPGAPAHWLAHVAERTSQLAEAGQAPLSLNSDPSAWPPARSDGPPLRPLAPEASPAPKAREPIARDPGVPSLADLRERSGEVWRRSEPERRRRPRPVFAAASAAPASDRLVRPAATPEPAPHARRPRSPLSLVAEPARATQAGPEPAAPSDTEASPARSAVPAHETTWSPAPVSRTTTHEPRWESPEAGPGRSTEQVSSDRVAAPSGSEASQQDRSEAFTHDTAVRRRALRQRSWFFAKSATARLGRALALSAAPEPSVDDLAETPEATAVGAAPKPRPAFPFLAADRRTDVPERVWRARPSSPGRHAIFRALTALRARPHPRAQRPAASDPVVATAAPPIDLSSSKPRPGPPAPFFTALAVEPRARVASILPPRDPPQERAAPSDPGEDRERHPAVGRMARQVAAATSAGEPHDKRPTYAARRPFTSRAVPRAFSDQPSDDRWPALPPATFAAPTGVEVPPPRWDQLAREQEEGRWSV